MSDMKHVITVTSLRSMIIIKETTFVFNYLIFSFDYYELKWFLIRIDLKQCVSTFRYFLKIEKSTMAKNILLL